MLKLILLFVLISCNSFKLEVRRVYSYTYNECRCQWYDINRAKNLGPYELCEVFYAREYPNMTIKPNMEYCDGMQGFSTEAIVKRITPTAHKIIRHYNDTCK